MRLNLRLFAFAIIAASRTWLSAIFPTSGRYWTAQFSAMAASQTSPSCSKRSRLFSNSEMAVAASPDSPACCPANRESLACNSCSILSAPTFA